MFTPKQYLLIFNKEMSVGINVSVDDEWIVIDAIEGKMCDLRGMIGMNESEDVAIREEMEVLQSVLDDYYKEEKI